MSVPKKKKPTLEKDGHPQSPYPRQPTYAPHDGPFFEPEENPFPVPLDDPEPPKKPGRLYRYRHAPDKPDGTFYVQGSAEAIANKTALNRHIEYDISSILGMGPDGANKISSKARASMSMISSGKGK